MSNLAQLKKIWYAKLKESGFQDIEYYEESSYGMNRFDKHPENPEVMQARADYYQMSTHFLSDHSFESDFEKDIWEIHADGISIRNITKVLFEKQGIKTSKTKVGKIVKRLEDTMKALYLPEYSKRHGSTKR